MQNVESTKLFAASMNGSTSTFAHWFTGRVQFVKQAMEMTQGIGIFGISRWDNPVRKNYLWCGWRCAGGKLLRSAGKCDDTVGCETTAYDVMTGKRTFRKIIPDRFRSSNVYFYMSWVLTQSRFIFEHLCMEIRLRGWCISRKIGF